MIGRVLRRLAVAMLGVALALAGIEGGLRLLPTAPWAGKFSLGPWQWLRYEPILGWENMPGFHDDRFRIDTQGFRGDDVAPGAAAKRLRIVCLGDSRTFGMREAASGFRFDNAYPDALRGVISQRRSEEAVEVINAGVVGYTSAHGLRQLVTRILPLRPDVVTVAFGFNDHSLAWNAALRCEEPENALLREALYGGADLRLFRLGLSVWQGMAFLHPRPLSVRWVDREHYAYNLRRIAAAAREGGAHVLFVAQALRPLALGESTPPAIDPKRDATKVYGVLGAKDLADLHRIDDEYGEILYRVAREAKVPVADAAAAFAAHEGEDLFSRYDAVHPAPKGAALIAETIYEELVGLGWLRARHAGGNVGP